MTYATVSKGYELEVEGEKFRAIIDANRDTKFKLILSFLSIFWTILRVWPHTIITTGAAPGFFAIFIGKLLGRKTIWLDSIANAEELSMSGQKAGKFATHWLTQWEHLAKPKGPHFFGNVLGDASEEQSSENGVQKSEVREQRTADRAPMEEIRSQATGDRDQSEENEGEEQRSEVGSQKADLGSQVSDLSKQNSFRIFVTVGTDQHFNRMVKIIDQWAAKNPEQEIFAQIGETEYQPSYIKFSKFLEPQEFIKRVKSSSLIIGHAGMGTIITALKYRKPILVMPKLASLGEHRNEHQSATAKRLVALGHIEAIFSEMELTSRLEETLFTPSDMCISQFASSSLTSRLALLLS